MLYEVITHSQKGLDTLFYALQQLVARHDVCLHLLGDGHDIAQAVAFLASPAAGYITGQTLHVNGGMYMA